MTKLAIRCVAVAMLGMVAGCACCRHSSPQIKHEATATTRPAAIPHEFAKWEGEIAAYETLDKANPPPKGASLFIGSSTIRLWKTLAQDFAEYKVINRGVGGSEIADATHFADRIIFPYEPRQVFIRAGGNDIHNGRLPDEVAQDFAELVEKVHERLPKTEVIYISLSPAPARWGEKEKNRELNRLVFEMALRMPRVSYVDLWDVTLTNDGKARKELFIADMLHFNVEGYKLLAERVRPYLPTPK